MGFFSISILARLKDFILLLFSRQFLFSFFLAEFSSKNRMVSMIEPRRKAFTSLTRTFLSPLLAYGVTKKQNSLLGLAFSKHNAIPIKFYFKLEQIFFL